MGKPVISVNKREIPVAPPSIKSFGNKKLFKPNPADKIPRMISSESRRLRIKALRFRYCVFAFLYLLFFAAESCISFLCLTTVCDISWWKCGFIVCVIHKLRQKFETGDGGQRRPHGFPDCIPMISQLVIRRRNAEYLATPGPGLPVQLQFHKITAHSSSSSR